MGSNQDYREFNADALVAKLGKFQTVNVNDVEMASDGLARVIVSYTGDLKGEDFRLALSKKFSGLGMPIRHSFKQLTANSVVGWVSANREVREYDEPQEKGKYRLIASNILMDRDDQTTWELKETESGGKYLSRQGIEDLSELAGSLVIHKTGVPRIAAMASIETAETEFVAFVNQEEGEVDYGYVIGKTEKGNKIVLSAITDTEVEVEAKYVVTAIDMEKADQKVWGKELAASDKNAMVEYYKQAYGYAPEYVQEIIQMINQHSYA